MELFVDSVLCRTGSVGSMVTLSKMAANCCDVLPAWVSGDLVQDGSKLL